MRLRMHMHMRPCMLAYLALSTSMVCTRPKRLDMRSPSDESAALAAGMRTKMAWTATGESPKSTLKKSGKYLSGVKSQV